MPGIDDPPASPDSQEYSADEAAYALLRNKNIHEFKSIISFAGMIVFPNGAPIQSGVTVMIANKGLFNGKWIIQMVRFALLEGKMVTEIDLRKCLPPGQTGSAQPPSTTTGEEGKPISDEVPDKPTTDTTTTTDTTPTTAVQPQQTQTDYARSQLSPEEQKLVDMAPNTGGAEQQAAIDKYNQGLADYLFKTNPVSH